MQSYKYPNHKKKSRENAGPSVDGGDNLVMDGMEKAWGTTQSSQAKFAPKLLCKSVGFWKGSNK